MAFFRNLPVRMDQEQLFNQMHIREDLWNYETYQRAYHELMEEIPRMIDPKGAYKLVPNRIGKMIHEDLSGLTHLVCSVVTLGPGISRWCTELFAERDYLKGLMIDAIADQMLFNLSDDFYTLIRADIVEGKHLGLTARYVPDKKRIPVHFQKEILDLTCEQERLRVSVTEDFMYNPIKSLGYVYGADPRICTATKDHDCGLCAKTDCGFRETA